MTKQELKEQLAKIVSNPDTMLADMGKLAEAIEADYDILESMRNQVDQYEVRIRNLQDTNAKLFLAQTGMVEDKEEEPELEGQDAIDAFFDELNKKGE